MKLLTPEQVADYHQAFHQSLKPAVQALGEQTVAAVDQEKVEHELIELQRAVCLLAEAAGFQPKDLTTSVHLGFSFIQARIGQRGI